MSIKASKIWCTKDKLYVELNDQRVLSVPLTLYPKLQAATIIERNNYELWEDGRWIHWEALDEDLSVEGLLSLQLHHPA